MEAGVVAPETGVRINGNNSGNNLRSQKEENGKIERGFGKGKFMFGE